MKGANEVEPVRSEYLWNPRMTCTKCQHQTCKKLGYFGKRRIQRWRCFTPPRATYVWVYAWLNNCAPGFDLRWGRSE